jgi:hypothetical protein
MRGRCSEGHITDPRNKRMGTAEKKMEEFFEVGQGQKGL